MYYGKQPQFEQYLTDNFTSSAATYPTGYPLTYNPGLAQAIEVVVGGAVQRPNIDYTISGQILLFSPSLPDGLTIFIRYLGLTGSTLGVVPDSSVTPTKLVETVLSKSVAGGVDVTLTAAEAANSVYEFTGTITANINVIVPNTVRRFTVRNYTSGAFTLTVKTSAGTGISATKWKNTSLYCNGTNVEDSNSSKAEVTGNSGQVFSAAHGTGAAHVTTLDQISLMPSVASAATVDFFGAAGATIDLTGTTTVTGITACAAGQVGSKKTIIPSNAAGVSFTASANMEIDGATSGTFLMPQNAIVEILATSTTTFRLVRMSRQSGTVTLTLTGCTTSPTIDFNYVKIGRVVTLSPKAMSISGTSSATTKTLTGLPSNLFPAVMSYEHSLSSDNGGAVAVSIYSVNASTGVFTLHPNILSSPWTASGTMMWYPSSCTYITVS